MAKFMLNGSIFYKTHTRNNNLYWSVSHCHYFELQLLRLNVLYSVSYVVDAWIFCGYHATVVQSLLNTVEITKIKVDILKNKK